MTGIEHIIGSVELGGTKAIVAIGRDPLKPLLRQRIPTRDPESTLGDIAAFFEAATAEIGPMDALGIASFGPIGIRRNAPDWGRMGRTTKPGWMGADVAGFLERRLRCATTLDTDVNGAALAEARWGAGHGLGVMAYLTIGTGIGGGIVVNGKPIHGATHPEMGHVRLHRHPQDSYRGRCVFHEDCAEGLASGPAILERLGMTASDLPEDHPFREILADYIGQLCATLLLISSPQRIIIGGGVMVSSNLHRQVQQAMANWLAGYVEIPNQGTPYIVPPSLGDDAGLAGGFALAQDLLRPSEQQERPAASS